MIPVPTRRTALAAALLSLVVLVIQVDGLLTVLVAVNGVLLVVVLVDVALAVDPTRLEVTRTAPSSSSCARAAT